MTVYCQAHKGLRKSMVLRFYSIIAKNDIVRTIENDIIAGKEHLVKIK